MVSCYYRGLLCIAQPAQQLATPLDDYPEGESEHIRVETITFKIIYRTITDYLSSTLPRYLLSIEVLFALAYLM